MTDIVERLESEHINLDSRRFEHTEDIFSEAVAEIKRLRAEIERLQKVVAEQERDIEARDFDIKEGRA